MYTPLMMDARAESLYHRRPPRSIRRLSFDFAITLPNYRVRRHKLAHERRTDARTSIYPAVYILKTVN